MNNRSTFRITRLTWIMGVYAVYVRFTSCVYSRNLLKLIFAIAIENFVIKS